MKSYIFYRTSSAGWEDAKLYSVNTSFRIGEEKLYSVNTSSAGGGGDDEVG